MNILIATLLIATVQQEPSVDLTILPDAPEFQAREAILRRAVKRAEPSRSFEDLMGRAWYATQMQMRANEPQGTLLKYEQGSAVFHRRSPNHVEILDVVTFKIPASKPATAAADEAACREIGKRWADAFLPDGFAADAYVRKMNETNADVRYTVVLRDYP